MAATVELIDGFRYEIAGSVQFPMPSQIAKELSLSVSTVSTYRARILRKMDMTNNAELTHYAVQHELVDRQAN